MYHHAVDNFCFSIGLWMKWHAALQLGVHHSPQSCPKLFKEERVPIRHNGCGKPKVDPYKLEEEMSSILCSDLLFTRN